MQRTVLSVIPQRKPEERIAQTLLAEEVTELVHTGTFWLSIVPS
jgi:hypothetical protein